MSDDEIVEATGTCPVCGETYFRYRNRLTELNTEDIGPACVRLNDFPALEVYYHT